MKLPGLLTQTDVHYWHITTENIQILADERRQSHAELETVHEGAVTLAKTRSATTAGVKLTIALPINLLALPLTSIRDASKCSPQLAEKLNDIISPPFGSCLRYYVSPTDRDPCPRGYDAMMYTYGVGLENSQGVFRYGGRSAGVAFARISANQVFVRACHNSVFEFSKSRPSLLGRMKVARIC